MENNNTLNKMNELKRMRVKLGFLNGRLMHFLGNQEKKIIKKSRNIPYFYKSPPSHKYAAVQYL